MLLRQLSLDRQRGHPSAPIATGTDPKLHPASSEPLPIGCYRHANGISPVGTHFFRSTPTVALSAHNDRLQQ